MNDILDRSYEELQQTYIQKVCDTWLGEVYEYAPQYGSGTIERYRLEPGVELNVYRQCTHERLAASLSYSQKNMIEITSIASGHIYVRYHPADDWLQLNNQLLNYFHWDNPISYYDIRYEQVDGIGLYINMDMMTTNMMNHQYWMEVLQRLFHMENRILSINSTPIQRTITKQLLRHYEENVMNYLLLKSKTLEFLSHCIPIDPAQELSYCGDARIREIKAKIDAHYYLPLQVRQLAAGFHIPVHILQSQFKQYYGLSVYRYIQKIRMEAAADLLLFTEESIIAIAMKVGYDNPSKFAAVFKAHYHGTPLYYRKKHRQLD